MTTLQREALKLGAGTDDRVVLGWDEWAEPISLPVADSSGAINWLLAGAPGSGKSNTLSVILADLARRPNTALVLGDPKMVEFGPWANRATCVGLGREAQVELLELLESEMMRRYRHLARSAMPARVFEADASLGVRIGNPHLAKLDADAVGGYVRKWRVGIDGPRLVTVFDELGAFLRGSGKAHDAMVARLVRLVTMGRAAEMPFILCTQRPSAATVNTDIRDSCQLRITHKTMSADQTEMVLGVQRIEGVRWQPHQLPIAYRGVGYLITDYDPQVLMFRADRMTDGDVVTAGRQVAPLRVTLNGWPISGRILPEDWDTPG